jgi:hypothetical protein
MLFAQWRYTDLQVLIPEDSFYHPDSLIFGTSSEATDNFDIGIDRSMPFSAIDDPAVYFYCDSFSFGEVLTDIRHYDYHDPDTLEWRVIISGTTESVIVQWNSESLPGHADCNFLLYPHISTEEPGDTFCDMRDNSSFTLEPSNIFTIRYITTTGIEEAKPDKRSLITAKPNPFNSNVQISYNNVNGKAFSIDIYDLLGNHVASLNDQVDSNKRSTFFWDGKDLDNGLCASGVYLVKVKSSDNQYIQKIILAK